MKRLFIPNNPALVFCRLFILILFLSGQASPLAAQTQLTSTDVYTGKADVTASQWVKLSPGFRAAEGCNVHVFISPGAAGYQPIVYSPTSGGTIAACTPTTTANYIRTTTLRDPVTAEANISTAQRIETIAYFDGLGRPVQTVTLQGSPAKNDLVEAVEYDDFGRDYCHLLPFVKASNNGAYVTDARSKAINYYNATIAGHESTASPWNKTLYEASPLNRTTGTSGPGPWEAKPTSVSYQTNTSTIDHWDAAKNSITFAAGSLYVTETTDEDGNKSREYKDKLGQVVRRESYDGTAWLRTAYVYDDFGQLIMVVPPKASLATDTELCYYYSYDQRRRMTVKDLPGAEPVYMVYDNRDRLALSQDGVQRPANKWSFTKYDALNRPVMTGEMVIAATRDNIADQFASYSGAMYEAAGTDLYGYTNQSFPATYNSQVTTDKILTVTYYDGYDFRPSGYEYQSNLAGEPSAYSIKTKGLVTGSRTKVLEGGESLVNPMALTVNYYDDYGRLVQSVADNHFETTSKEVAHTAYNFAGQPVKTVTEHRKGNSSCQQTLAATFDFDHQGRLLTQKMTINSDNAVTLSSLTYNELGEVVARYLHGDAAGNNFNQKIDYAYNLKGWLRTINSPGNLGADLMAIDLRYNNPQTGVSLGGTSLYNGNIAQMMWDTGTPAGYGFTYDGLSRLRSATYADGAAYTSNPGRYSTAYTYDANGNFDTHSRYIDATQVDNLKYSYQAGGNRIGTVTDATGNTLGYKAVNGNYLYDNNGNMTYDVSKGFTIAYNRLNLPEKISCANDYAQYTYDASGAKLVKTITNGPANTTRYYYSGPFLYENSALKSIFTPEGRIVVMASQPGVLNRFEYNLKDHLGNTRVAFTGHADGKPEVNQLTAYDPFGFIVGQTSWYATGNAKNKMLYNGKEWQDDALAGTKIDWFDFGARMYDPELGRWSVIDNKAEKYYSVSQYTYALSNPIKYIDPDGNEIVNALKNATYIQALQNFLSTKEGKTYAARYMGANSHIIVGGVGYTFNENGKAGDRANDVLTFKEYNSTYKESENYGSTKTAPYDLDPEKYNMNFTNENQIDKGFNESIGLYQGMNAQEATSTLGHEAFVHGNVDADNLTAVEKNLKNGVYKTTFDLMKDIKDRFFRGTKDHKAYKLDQVKKYKDYSKELTNKTGNKYYIDDYEKDKNKYNNEGYEY